MGGQGFGSGLGWPRVSKLLGSHVVRQPQVCVALFRAQITGRASRASCCRCETAMASPVGAPSLKQWGAYAVLLLLFIYVHMYSFHAVTDP